MLAKLTKVEHTQKNKKMLYIIMIMIEIVRGVAILQSSHCEFLKVVSREVGTIICDIT